MDWLQTIIWCYCSWCYCIKRANELCHKICDLNGDNSIIAVQIVTAPSVPVEGVSSSRESLLKSMEEILFLDWRDSKIVIEHVDSCGPDLNFEKGFLTLEDEIEVLLKFENGCVANLTASRISMKNMRKSRFFQKDAYISIDFLEKKCEVVKMKDAPKNPDDFAMILTNAEGVKKQIYFENPNVDDNNAILDELEAFADAINTNTTPIVTLEQGTEALRVAMQIIENFKDI